MTEPLTCPRCALAHPISERFCRNCGMPLVYSGTGEQQPITDAHERARKVRPQYARGDPVRVTGGRNLADSELIQGILLDQGIPSTLRRTRGFDVPDFLAAGPRDVMVPQSGYARARELLRDADLLTAEAPPRFTAGDRLAAPPRGRSDCRGHRRRAARLCPLRALFVSVAGGSGRS